MSKDICIVCVAFGKQYVRQQKRLKQTIDAHCPDAHTIFWTEQLPEGSKPFYESLYGFKVHAVKKAMDEGYKKIVFLDPACLVCGPLDYYFTLGLPVIAARDDNKLKNHICDHAVHYYLYGKIPDNWHLVGGSLYVFDFNHERCQRIFDSWYTAESKGIFGSQAEQSVGLINKHRNDESCMAMALYTKGFEPIGCDEARYCCGSDMIIDKKHFK